MRTISSHYDVSFKINNNSWKNNTICYGHLFNLENVNQPIYLKDYLAIETYMYAVKYIDKLCKIFNISYSFENKEKSELKLYNIPSRYNLKCFLTLFRILFEGKHNSQNAELNVKFIKSFVENEYKIKDLLKRLIHCHNETKLFLGGNHCIKQTAVQVLALKTKKDFLNYDPGTLYSVQQFFK